MKIVFLKSQKDLASVKAGDMIESESSELLRKAVSKKVLVNPLNAKNFFRDDALVRSIAESNSTFAIPLSVISNARGSSRARLLRDLKLFFRLCFRLKAKFVFTNAYAKTKFDVKGKRDVRAIGSLFALTPLQAKEAFENGGAEVLTGSKK